MYIEYKTTAHPYHYVFLRGKDGKFTTFKIKDDAKAYRAKGFLVKIVNGKYVGQWTRRKDRWYKEW